ncbi:MAG: tetratricopeptide repeat protein [Acidobacteriaceae bacterium]|nr:tetratricopeptide repeat protein [Acidobacteriaceae bacterium]
MVVRFGAAFAILAIGLAPCAFTQSADRVESLYLQAKSAEQSGDMNSATSKYQEILKIAPETAPAYNNLGAVYFKQGRYAQAVDILEQGLKVDPKMTSASALLGMTFFEMGEYAKARPRLEAVVDANPNDSNAEFLLVNDLTKLGEFQAAAEHLEKLSAKQPGNQQVWYQLAKVYMQLSEEALGRINQINPNSVWAHEISAELMESMRNYDGAIVEWKKAEQVAPRQPGVHYKLGDLYWSLSQWGNATSEFEQELALDPRNCRAEWKLGDILIQKSEQPEAALVRLEKALAGCPNLVEARADRGRLLLRLHREREAIADLNAAEKSNPSEPSTHFLLAQAYRALGDSQQAQAEMKSFTELETKARAAAAERAQEAINNSQSAH